MMERLRRRLHVRSAHPQGGYILVTTLLAMLLCVILISSMLAVTQAVVPIEESGRVREKQARAAESAVELAVNQIRNDPTSASANPMVPKKSCNTGYVSGRPDSEQLPKEFGDADCDGAGPDTAYDATLDPTVNRAAVNGVCSPLGNLVNIDGYPVRVYCYNEGLRANDGQGGADQPAIPLDDGALAVRLVGGNYTGDPVPASDPITDVARTWKTGFPFSSAVTGYSGSQITSEVNATNGQLLYTGVVPLSIVGGVEVRNQIAAVGTTADTPALDVQGSVRQGGKGMFSSGSGAQDCGIAQVSGPTPLRTNVVVNSNVAVPADKMLCNQNDVASMAAGGMLPPDGDWNYSLVAAERYVDWDGNNSRFRANASGVYDANSWPTTDCGTLGDIISIPQGSYDKYATKILNYWFSGTACNNKTYVFEDGNYYFDVDDPSLGESDPRKHSLVFADRTSNWIFGTPTYAGYPGVRPNVEDFPNVCDRNNATAADGSNGVSITLSSRTGLHHSGGRVAICGPILTSSGHSTAIYQRPANSLGVRLLPTAVTANGWAFADVARLQQTDGTGGSMLRERFIPPECWDSGTCVDDSDFTATFAAGGVNGQASPGTVTSFWVDLVANGGNRVENPAQDLAKTRFDLTLANGTTCYMEYGPNRAYRPRVTTNSAFSSYNLKADPTNNDASDGVDGNCDTVLASAVNRSDVYGSTVKVSFRLNPPKLTNNKFAFFDQIPIIGGLLRQAAEALCAPFVSGWNSIAGGISNFLNAAIGFVTGNSSALNLLINYYSACDDRPPKIEYRVDSIALRTGWSPQVTDAVDALGTSASGGVTFVNAANAAANVSGYAEATIPAGQGSSYSKVRYTLRDPNLQDGFLPLDEVTFGAKIRKTGTAAIKSTDRVVFTLKTPINTNGGAPFSMWCRRSVRLSDIATDADFSFSTPLRLYSQSSASDADVDTSNTGQCKKVADQTQGPWVPANANEQVDIGELVSHWDNTDAGSRVEVKAYLDVEVYMDNAGAAASKTVGVDYATVTATAGDRVSGVVNGYPRPKDPFTITWSPRTYDAAAGYSPASVNQRYGRAGDATFNVWGSVSVPNNDVRVIYNYGANMMGPTGYPIFNAGKVTIQDCGPTRPERCRPALVASALGAWTTGSWPSPVPVEQLPDPLASTGNTRLPFRQVRILACVVDDHGGNGDQLLPRANARVIINDRKGKAVVPGSEVIVDQWDALRSDAWRYNADATTKPCNPLG